MLNVRKAIISLYTIIISWFKDFYSIKVKLNFGWLFRNSTTGFLLTLRWIPFNTQYLENKTLTMFRVYTIPPNIREMKLVLFLLFAHLFKISIEFNNSNITCLKINNNKWLEICYYIIDFVILIKFTWKGRQKESNIKIFHFSLSAYIAIGSNFLLKKQWRTEWRYLLACCNISIRYLKYCIYIFLYILRLTVANLYEVMVMWKILPIV